LLSHKHQFGLGKTFTEYRLRPDFVEIAPAASLRRGPEFAEGPVVGKEVGGALLRHESRVTRRYRR
jgi:hypothetical protein